MLSRSVSDTRVCHGLLQVPDLYELLRSDVFDETGIHVRMLHPRAARVKAAVTRAVPGADLVESGTEWRRVSAARRRVCACLDHF